MPQIDVNTISGYAGMTAEQKVAALEAFSYEDNSAEVTRLRSSITALTAESAGWKRKYNETLSAEEQAKQAREDELTTLREQVKSLQRENTLNSYKTQFVGLGYNDQLAAATAEAMVNGDMATVFANQQAFLTSHDKELKAGLLAGTKKPEAPGQQDAVMTLDAFRKLDPSARLAFANEHPAEYESMYAKG